MHLQFCSRVRPKDRELFPYIFKDPRAKRPTWLLSRLALSQLLFRMGLNPRRSLSIKFPHKNFSLSHKKNIAVAFYAPGLGIKGAGVDIENLRKFSSVHFKYFLNSKEMLLLKKTSKRDPYLGVKLWAIKEALLKADSKNSDKFLKDYSLPNLKTSAMEVLVGNRVYSYRCKRKDAHVVAIAYRVASSE